MNAGDLDEAENLLQSALDIKRKIQDVTGIPENVMWLGELYELRAKRTTVDVEVANLIRTAESYYYPIPEYPWGVRPYFLCAALTGFTRVKYIQGEYIAMQTSCVEAEQLALQYEYNDHLASLRLTQAHIVWDGKISEWSQGFDAALKLYKQALIYALRYNRFLLDEMLSGRPQGTPLHPIIPYCLERGEEGRKMLTALLDWWHTRKNDIGTPRPDTISPIPERIALLEAERLAREREPGDSSAQKTVIDQIEASLK